MGSWNYIVPMLIGGDCHHANITPPLLKPKPQTQAQLLVSSLLGLRTYKQVFIYYESIQIHYLMKPLKHSHACMHGNTSVCLVNN